MTARPEKDVATRIARVVGGAMWLGATLWGAAVCFSIAIIDTATFFGEPPTDEMRREGILFSLAGGLIAALGPIGVWFFYRRNAWLYLAMALGSLGIGYAGYVGIGLGSG